MEKEIITIEKCEHEYFIEPHKDDLHKAKFSNKEWSRLVARCRICRNELNGTTFEIIPIE